MFDNANLTASYATVKRLLTKLSNQNHLVIVGKGKSTKYKIPSSFQLLQPIDLDIYYQKEIDERTIK